MPLPAGDPAGAMADKNCALSDKSIAAIARRCRLVPANSRPGNAILYAGAALPLSNSGDIKQRITLSPCES